MKPSPWLIRSSKSDDADTRLFAFPFSGGSATSYASWRGWLNPRIDLFCVQPPGRGVRMAEPPIRDIEQLLTQLVPDLLPLLDRPYLLYGHSNGALMAFAVANRLLQLGAPAPRAIALSAKCSPTVNKPRERVSELPDDRFIAKLSSLNGTPRELLNNPEIMQLFFPALRADFAVGENFRLPAVHPQLARIPALIVAGEHDETLVADVFAWGELFQDSRQVAMAGGHFFINTNPAFVRTLHAFLQAHCLPEAELVPG
ncbi:thioesterase II family protein [Pseudomonas sp. CGJS7]|uniref:thioesterase II family protein n=1 Tax=Pseudomonas sp. CGJS7 TaxID=3109348 RepID=UPI003009C737